MIHTRSSLCDLIKWWKQTNRVNQIELKDLINRANPGGDDESQVTAQRCTEKVKGSQTVHSQART